MAKPQKFGNETYDAYDVLASSKKNSSQYIQQGSNKFSGPTRHENSNMNIVIPSYYVPRQRRYSPCNYYFYNISLGGSCESNIIFGNRAGSDNIFFVDIDCEIFSTIIPSLPLIQEGQLSASGKRMCTSTVLRGQCRYLIGITVCVWFK